MAYPTGAANFIGQFMAGKADKEKRADQDELKKLILNKTKIELDLMQKKGQLMESLMGGVEPDLQVPGAGAPRLDVPELDAGKYGGDSLINKLAAAASFESPGGGGIQLPEGPEEAYKFNAMMKYMGLPEYQPKDYSSSWRPAGEGQMMEFGPDGQPTGKVMQTPMTAIVATPGGGERQIYGLPSGLYGGRGIQTKPEQIHERVPASELIRYVDADGEHPGTGITYGALEDAVASGEYELMSPVQQTQTMSLRGADRMISTLRELGDEIFTDETTLQRLWSAVKNPALGFLQAPGMGEKIALYRKYQQGFIASLVRTFGEKGTLNEGDIQRAINLLPRIYPIPDNKAVYQANMDELAAFVDELAGRKERDLSADEAEKNISDLSAAANAEMKRGGLFDAEAREVPDQDAMKEAADLGWRGPGRYDIEGYGEQYIERPEQFIRMVQ